ncbi:carbohydrate ABC transporter permease [Paenibacillus puerhi]|uniref:carbohydrate ABC transporter permease n=1 Tax=Paenibacillus puerhi TaxID=2692622 RepID=UPI00135730DD|nr:sugar ABC transporter permease [Paenibacillus puerhi]
MMSKTAAAPELAAHARAGHRRARSRKKWLVYASFLMPSFLLYGIFLLWPVIQAVQLSLFDWDGSSSTMTFVGMGNYTRLAEDPIFLKGLSHNFIWVLLSLILVVIPTLLLAILISKVKKGKLLFRAGFYLPSVLSLAVIGVLWSKIYDPNAGPINEVLRKLGLESLTHNWLGEPLTVLPALVVASTWAFYGLYMILYLAGLQNVDYSVYEAADIDGAGPIGKFWHITVPSLSNTINVVVSMVVIYAFKGFAIVWIMTQGGPFYMSEIVPTYVYKAAFSMNKVGYATAGSLVLGIIVMSFTFLFNYLREKRE